MGIGDVLQPTHLIFILVVALLVLGPKRLPEVGRSLGRGIRDFRGALSGADEPASTSTEREFQQSDPQPVTPATTTLSADAQPDDDHQVMPADWPVAEDANGEGAGQSGSGESAGAVAHPAAPAANPFRQD